MTEPNRHIHLPTRSPHRTPGPTPVPPAPTEPAAPVNGPTETQLADFARHVLSWHRAATQPDGRAPTDCTCGSPLVLCAYRNAATRHLGPPTDPRRTG